MLKKGDSGNEVRELQQLLVLHGFMHSSDVDGEFGPGTDDAVRQFQDANDLKADGLVGPRTWNELRVASRVPPYFATDRERLLTLIKDEPDSPQKRAVLFAINDLNRKEEPNGSNGGDAIKHLVHNPFQGDQTYYDYIGWYPGGDKTAMPPWCALAVSNWIAFGIPATHWQGAPPPSDSPKVKAHPFPKWFGGVAQIEEWAGDAFNKRTKFKGAWPTGAIFTMGRSGSGSDPSTSIRNGHTGLVVIDDGDTILTVEGNTGNSVAHKVRKKTALRGFVTWW